MAEKHTSKGPQKAQRTSKPLEKRLYTIPEAASYLGRSPYALRSLIWAGTLPVVKENTKQWLDIVDLNHFIEVNKQYHE